MVYRFIHIPKTGGTTIVEYLRQNKIDFLWGDNSGTHLPKSKHGRAQQWIHESNPKFCCVRHPATRLVSYFQYFHQQFGVYENISFSQFLRDRLDLSSSNGKKLSSPWIPQSQWFMVDDQITVDRLLTFENLEIDLVRFLFGPKQTPIISVPRLNISNHEQTDLLSWYSERDYRRVRKAFARDFEVLGYD